MTDTSRRSVAVTGRPCSRATTGSSDPSAKLRRLSDLHPFLDHPGPIPFAHRGGADDHPENTLAAFQASIDLGFRYLETDVHATADGELVAFHDDRLDRVTDGTGAIAELTWAEIRRARVGGTDEQVPRLADILTTWPDVRVNIDPKDDRAVEPLVDVLRRHDALHRVCVGSFSDARLATLADRLGPELCQSFGPRGLARFVLGSWGLPVRPPRGHALQIPPAARFVRLATERTVHRAHDLGLHVHVWTIDDPGEMHDLLDLGVDGIMTDRPSDLREVLTARGQWVA